MLFFEEKSDFFEIEYLLGISHIGLILFKTLEAVIYSGELSEGSIVL